MKLSPRDKLGPYEIVELIGRGGMGEVYRATDTRLGRLPSRSLRVIFNDRFEREAHAISALNHPNIERWRGDGKELFFADPGGEIMAVDLNGTGAAFQTGVPHKLFALARFASLDVTADGKRFLTSVLPGDNGQGAQTPITVVLNWQADLKK